MSGIKLIVGLGNPGDQYEFTRHNAGFWFVDEVATQFGVGFRPESKFFGHVARIQTPSIDCWLLKPTTFMNRSGQAIQALARFYKIPVSAILVAHDELDLPAGVAKLKQAGGHGGHNGLHDTINTLGKEFLRLRLGIDHPGHKDQVVEYVLKKPSKIDRAQIDEACYQASKVIPELTRGDTAAAMQTLHTKA